MLYQNYLECPRVPSLLGLKFGKTCFITFPKSAVESGFKFAVVQYALKFDI